MARGKAARAEAAEIILIDPTLTLESFAKARLLKGQANIDLTFYALRKAGLK